MQIFLGEKAFFKPEMKISSFEDAGHNLNRAPDMACQCRRQTIQSKGAKS